MNLATAPMAKKKDQRIEFVADEDWLERATAEAERWGISLAAYIRIAVTEKMERDERHDETARRRAPKK